MNDLIANNELADKFLNLELKYDDLAAFLSGSPECKLTTRDSYR